MAIRIDVMHENFDLFFSNQIKVLTEYQKGKIPKELLSKLYKGGDEFNPRNTSQLSVLERLLILNKALNKRIFISIEDESGISLEEYQKARSDFKKLPVNNGEIDNELTATFFLSNKELADGFQYLNEQCTSPMYNYLHRIKNIARSKIKKFKEQSKFIMNTFVNYEAGKKMMLIKCGLNMPELLVMMYLYGNGGYTKTAHLHQEVFKYCFQSSPRRIKQAFGSLQSKGYVSKRGNTITSEMSITELGKEKMLDIVEKYLSKL